MIIENSYDLDKDLTTYQLTNDSSKLLIKSSDLAVFFLNDIQMG